MGVYLEHSYLIPNKKAIEDFPKDNDLFRNEFNHFIENHKISKSFEQKFKIERPYGVDNTYEVELEDYYVTEDIEILSQFLSEFFTGTLTFVTEDHLWFRIELIRAGEYKEIGAAIVFSNPYEHFMQWHSEDLPSKLKDDLDKWRIARKL